MHRRRTGIHLVLAVVIALALSLSACAKKNEGGASSPASETPKASAPASQAASSPAASEAANLDPYEVVITYRANPQKDDALIEAEMNKFLKDKINATVKLQPIAGSDYKKRTELAMNTGEKMDLIFTASWLDFFSNITKGAYLELDELLDQHGQGIKERLNPLYLEAPRLNGKLYAVPTNKEITQGKAFTFRTDIVEKYNIPIESINNMKDLEPWFEKLSKEEPEMIQLYSTGGGIPFMMYETNSTFRPVGPTPAKVPMFFVDTASSDVQVKTLIDPEIDAINKSEYELYRSYYEKGYINADAATTKTNVADIRKQGKIWIQSTVWKPGADASMAASDGTGYEFVSHVVEEPIVTTDLATGSMFSISRTSKDPARAMMVLNYLHTDKDFINLFVHGIEGKHYNKVGDNRIELIKDSGYAPGTNWVVGNQLLNYLLPGEPDDLYTNWEKFNNEAKRFPLLGFVFDDSNVKDTITQLTAVAQDYNVLGSGVVANPSKLLDERTKRLKEAGIEKVRDELQKQIDAWWAANKK